jgi:hypothetical protein
MTVAELNSNTQTEYFLVPKRTQFSAPQSCSRIELDLSQAVDRKIAHIVNFYLLRDGLSVDLDEDRLGICCDRQINSTSELGEFLQSRAFSVIIDPPSAQQAPIGHIAYITFASTKCIAASCVPALAEPSLLVWALAEVDGG